MPICYCGGVTKLEEVKQLVRLGVEKVAVNSGALERPEFLSEMAATIGSSSTVGVMDVKKPLWGPAAVWSYSGRKVRTRDPVAYARELQRLGVGEILLNAADRDGTREGYDLALVERVAGAVQVPVIALGGASSMSDISAVLNRGASAAAAGSLFVFHGSGRAVLLNFPKRRL